MLYIYIYIYMHNTYGHATNSATSRIDDNDTDVDPARSSQGRRPLSLVRTVCRLF